VPDFAFAAIVTGTRDATRLTFRASWESELELPDNHSFRIALRAVVAKNYILRLKCPHGDGDQLLNLRNREETLAQIQNALWHFECPLHGVQHEIPVEVRETATAHSSEAQPIRAMTVRKTFKARRRSKRLHLRIPVAVYGRNNNMGAFREETATDLVSAHGGLVALSARVGLGETLLVVNKATQEEQQCRAVYIGPLEGSKKKVGFALQRSAPYFWRVDFPPMN
jgi:hypothetical protein